MWLSLNDEWFVNGERRRDEDTGLSLVEKQHEKDCEQGSMVYDGGTGLSVFCVPLRNAIHIKSLSVVLLEVPSALE